MAFYIEIAGSLLLLAYLAIYLPLIGHGKRGTTMADLCVIFSILYLAGGSALGIFSDLRLGYRSEAFADSENTLLKCYFGIFLFLFGLTLSNFGFEGFRTAFLKMQQRYRDPLFFMVRRLDLVPLKGVLLIFGAIWLYRLTVISLGGGISGFGGASVTLKIPYPLVVMNYIIAPAAAFIIFYGVFRAFFARQRNYLFLIPTAMELLFLLAQGRREVLFGIFAVVFVYLAFGRRISLIKLGGFGLVGLVFLTIYSTVFLDLRSEALSIRKQNPGTSAVQAFYQAITEDQKAATEIGEAEEKAAANLQTRGRLGLYWIFMVVDGLEDRRPMLGEATFAAAMSALPRKVRPIRYWFDHAAFIQSHYGYAAVDVSDNFVALGLADFWLFGPLASGFMLGFLLNWLNYLSMRYFFHEPLIAILIFCTAYEMAINFEISPVAMFVAVRNVIVILVGFKVLRMFGIRIGKGYRPKAPRQGHPAPAFRF